MTNSKDKWSFTCYWLFHWLYWVCRMIFWGYLVDDDFNLGLRGNIVVHLFVCNEFNLKIITVSILSIFPGILLEKPHIAPCCGKVVMSIRICWREPRRTEVAEM
jgi:hypothetical protein